MHPLTDTAVDPAPREGAQPAPGPVDPTPAPRRRRFGLLPRILVAIVLGILLGLVLPETVARVFTTFNGVFSGFLGFLIPLIIVGLVTPAIAELGHGAGKMLAATAGIAYLSTLLCGLFALALSLLLHLLNTARPHVAEVGLVPGSQHFRNIQRHQVETLPGVLMLRVDESLYFANARAIETMVLDRLAADPAIREVVLMCSAVNVIDFSALESLEALATELAAQKVRLHLSEVKGPVMDRLKTTHFLRDLNGEVFLSQYDAWKSLAATGPTAKAR